MIQTITHRNLDVMVSAIKVQFLKWVGCSGEFIAIPVEISEKIAEMQKLDTMTDEQARNMSAENRRAFAHAMYELGIE